MSKGGTERAVTIIMPARAPPTHPDNVSKKEVAVLNTADVVWLWVSGIPWFIQYLRYHVITDGGATPPYDLSLFKIGY